MNPNDFPAFVALACLAISLLIITVGLIFGTFGSP